MALIDVLVFLTTGINSGITIHRQANGLIIWIIFCILHLKTIISGLFKLAYALS